MPAARQRRAGDRAASDSANGRSAFSSVLRRCMNIDRTIASNDRFVGTRARRAAGT